MTLRAGCPKHLTRQRRQRRPPRPRMPPRGGVSSASIPTRWPNLIGGMRSRIESYSLPKEGKRQESSSFLKKRTKKLFSASRTRRSHRPRYPKEQEFFVS